MKPSGNLNKTKVQDLFMTLSDEQESSVAAGLTSTSSCININGVLVQPGQTLVRGIKDLAGGIVGAIGDLYDNTTD